ncbi:MAG TPA: ATP-binding cassette domain-containing protein [Thermoleophilia bacterium]|nr:ATP-binding cassette domain-containing protein [Thermoleophilia bacterium]
MNPSAADKRPPLIDIAGLRFRYPSVDEDALADFDLRIGEGEFVVVVGANGSGKSTLARLLGGLDKPTGARQALGCGHDLLTDQGRLDVRRDVGVLFQNPENQLVAQCVEEDIAFGLENLGWSAADMRRRVDEMLARFQLEDLRHREPHLLSGGQKQRTALAGVLAVPRRVLVLDEPTAMLDAVGRQDVLAAVSELQVEGLAIVFITQEMDEVVGADRVVALEKGTAVFEGTAADLFADIDLVIRLRLGLPAPAALAVALGERGRRLPRLPLTIDELLAELASPS